MSDAADDPDDEDLAEATLSGDLRRDFWPAPDAPRVNAYLGNGRFGGCFDAYGLQNGGGIGQTMLMHADHSALKDGVPEFHPLAQIKWAGDAPLNGAPAPSYEQALRLNHGWLFTEMNWGGLDLAVVGLFHPLERDLFVLSIDYTCSGSKTVPPLLLAPAGAFDLVECNPKERRSHLRTREGPSTDLFLRVISEDGRAQVDADPRGTSIRFSGKTGQHTLLIGASATARSGELEQKLREISAVDALLRDGVAAWQKLWTAGGVELSDLAHQALYERSVYMLLCSCDGLTDFPAHGWTGNGPRTPNPATRGEALGIFQTLGLDRLPPDGAPPSGIAARNIDEFLTLTQTDAEAFQFFDVAGAPYSLAAHAVFVNTVHATLLGDCHGAQTQSWPLSWDGAAFENLRLGDGSIHSARRENGTWSELE